MVRMILDGQQKHVFWLSLCGPNCAEQLRSGVLNNSEDD
jgi:hypothetical protein